MNEEVLDRLCEQASAEDGGEWSHDADIYGVFDCNFTCPCGDTIEPDGECSQGHVAPLRRYRLI